MPAEGRPIVDHYFMGQGDTLPPCEATLLDGDGNPVPLFGATIAFRMKERDPADPDNPVAVTGPATTLDTGSATDGTRGQVRYPWASGDCDQPGEYDQDWVVTTVDGDQVTFPNPDKNTVTVTAAPQ